MKLRNKFLIALTGLVVLMAGVFFAISEGYTVGLFREYAAAAEKNSADQLAQEFQWAYEAQGNSWNGADEIINMFLTTQPVRARTESLKLVDTKTNQKVYQFPPTSPGGDTTEDGDAYQYKVPITDSGGRTVGMLYIEDRSTRGLFEMEQTIQHSMSLATIGGTLATAFVALLLGAWLVRLITNPLHSMMKTMKKIEEGNLETRLAISGQDEFGQVASAFNAMIDKVTQTEQSRRHLVADVAHELRTPLTIMQGKLELIQQGVEPATPENLLPIQDEIVRLTMLVQDLHQLSLAEVGKLPLHKESTDMNELVQRLVDNFSFEADDHDIHVFFTPLGGNTVFANVDPNRITQVLANLVGNAIRYTPAGGTVRVIMQREGGQLRISVQDTGPGISQEHLRHIFDRFYRVQEDRSRESGGTGLGLAIAKEFVEAHGGTIDVSSSPGAGTTFTISLPL